MNTFDEAVKRYEAGDAWDDASEEVELDIRVPLDKVMPVRLTADQWAALRRRARDVGVGPSTLARMWIVEKLDMLPAQSAPLRSAAAEQARVNVRRPLMHAAKSGMGAPSKKRVAVAPRARGTPHRGPAEKVAPKTSTKPRQQR